MVVLLSLVLLTRGWWWSAAGSLAMVLGAFSLYLREVPIPAECSELPAVDRRARALDRGRDGDLPRGAAAAVGAGRATRASRAERLRIEAEVRKATERARDARVDAVLAATVPLLDTLAAGLADPADDGVRRQCAAAESALRSLLTLGPTHDALRDLLGEAVLDAYAQGSALEVMPSLRRGEPPRRPRRLASERTRAASRTRPAGEPRHADRERRASRGAGGRAAGGEWRRRSGVRELLREVVDALPPERSVPPR